MLTATTSNSNLALPLTHSMAGLGNPFSQGAGDCTIKGESLFLCLLKNINTEALPVKSFMVGVLGSIRACWLLDPVYQPNTSTAQSLVTFGGSLKTTVKELAMSQHSYNQNHTKQNPLTISVSEIKPKPSLKKTSRFNILNDAKQLIAERVTFDQAKQYQNCIVKFAGMEGSQVSHLTEQQQETLLNTQYAIKTALIELSEFNHLEIELQALSPDGLVLAETISKAASSLQEAKVLADKLVSDMEGKS